MYVVVNERNEVVAEFDSRSEAESYADAYETINETLVIIRKVEK